MNATSTAALLAVLPLFFSGCTEKAGAAAGAPAGEPNRAVASVDGMTITWEEMEKEAAPHLIPIRQDEYEARRGAIEQIIYDKLLAREAQHRGLTSEALLKDEVDGKLTPVSAAEVERAYEANKARFGGRPKEDVLRDIEKALSGQQRGRREAQFRQQLFERAKITMNLEAPRVPITFPAGTPSVGNADAKVTLVEFSDYQCPYCHRAQDAVDQILKQYGDKLRFVHREFPIPGHPRAVAAAIAARCANEQGRFWDYHRSLMTVPGDFSDSDLQKRAGAVGIDGAKLGECAASGRFEPVVEESLRAARGIGVNATPTFYLNGRMLPPGAVPAEELASAIDEELKRKGS